MQLSEDPPDSIATDGAVFFFGGILPEPQNSDDLGQAAEFGRFRATRPFLLALFREVSNWIEDAFPNSGVITARSEV